MRANIVLQQHLYISGLATSDVAIIQSFLLLTFCEDGFHHSQSVASLRDIYMKHVRRCKLHKRNSPPALSDASERVRRRLWWLCYIRDREIVQLQPTEDRTITLLNDADHVEMSSSDYGGLIPSIRCLRERCPSLYDSTIQDTCYSMCIAHIGLVQAMSPRSSWPLPSPSATGLDDNIAAASGDTSGGPQSRMLALIRWYMSLPPDIVRLAQDGFRRKHHAGQVHALHYAKLMINFCLQLHIVSEVSVKPHSKLDPQEKPSQDSSAALIARKCCYDTYTIVRRLCDAAIIDKLPSVTATLLMSWLLKQAFCIEQIRGFEQCLKLLLATPSAADFLGMVKSTLGPLATKVMFQQEGSRIIYPMQVVRPLHLNPETINNAKHQRTPPSHLLQCKSSWSSSTSTQMPDLSDFAHNAIASPCASTPSAIPLKEPRQRSSGDEAVTSPIDSSSTDTPHDEITTLPAAFSSSGTSPKRRTRTSSAEEMFLSPHESCPSDFSLESSNGGVLAAEDTTSLYWFDDFLEYNYSDRALFDLLR